MRKIPNTFGIDVTAARFLEYGSEDELRELIAAGQVVAPWLHIGGHPPQMRGERPAAGGPF